MAAKGKGSGRRELTVRVKTAKGRKLSSTLWLQRQLNDPYVVAAKKDGYRSRATYKLIEINERYNLLRPGMKVLDLGAAPGGWSQFTAKRVRAGGKGRGQVIALDINEMDDIPNVSFLLCDFEDPSSDKMILDALDGEKADAVISDMAAPSTGHKKTDHLRIIGLCEAALYTARQILAPNGIFLAKVLQGGTERELLNDMKKDFEKVYHVKPKASRADSSELFVLATGFRGGAAQDD